MMTRPERHRPADLTAAGIEHIAATQGYGGPASRFAEIAGYRLAALVFGRQAKAARLRRDSRAAATLGAKVLSAAAMAASLEGRR